MSSIGTGYDLSASQFSPDGRVFQVEYAHKAVENSGTVIGLRGKDCIVLAVERIVTSKLLEQDSNKRIFHVDSHVGLAASGLLSDGRQIVDTARREAANYRNQYGGNIQVSVLTDRVASYMHAYTLYSAVRPFGCSIIMAGYDEKGPSMYMIDPSGVSNGYFGCAIGKARQAAKTEIEKLRLNQMSCHDLVREAAKIIYLVHDELKDKQFELEMSWVGAISSGKHVQVPDSIFSEAEKAARAAMEDESDSDTEEI